MTDAFRSADHRRSVLERATTVSAGWRVEAVIGLLELLESEFGPSELHVATPAGLVLAHEGSRAAADLSLVAATVEHRRTSVGDGRLGPGTSLTCPVLVSGRVVAVVAISRTGGWEPALATLADGVVVLGTPCLVAEQRRVVEAAATAARCGTERVRSLVHDDAVQVLVAVAERLDLVRTGVVTERELHGLPSELRDAAARLAAGVGAGNLG